MLLQVVLATVPATIVYAPQSVLRAGEQAAEYHVANILSVQRESPCSYYLLSAGGPEAATVRDTVFYANLTLRLTDF